MAVNFEPEINFTPDEEHQAKIPETIRPDTSSPAFYELEKQPGTPKTPLALLSQYGEQMKEALTSPMPGSLVTLPVRALSQTAQQTGAEVAKRMAGSGSTLITARLAGAGVSTVLDPLSYAGFGLHAPATEEAIAEGASKPGIFKQLADNFIGLFKRKPTPEEINTAVENVAESHAQAIKKVAEDLNRVKEKAGVPQLSKQQQVEALAKSEGQPSTPGAIAQEFLEYQKTAPKYAPKMEEAGMDVNALKQQIEPIVDKLKLQPRLHPDLPTVPVDEKGNTSVEGPHAIFIGRQKFPGHPDIDMYDVRNSSLNSASNERLTLSGEEGLQRLKDAKIPIVGKDPRAGEQTPNLAYGELFKSPESLKTPEKPPVSDKFATPGDELAYLIDLKQRLGQATKAVINQPGLGKGVNVGRAKTVAELIDERMSEIPGGDAIVAHNKEYSAIVQSLQKAQKGMGIESGELKNPGQAEDYLRRVMTAKSGKLKDVRDKLAIVQQMSGQSHLDDLFELFKQQQQGFSYEQLKHPLASAFKQGLPRIGDVVRGPLKKTAQVGLGIAGGGISRGFGMDEENKRILQSIKDRLNANKTGSQNQ